MRANPCAANQYKMQYEVQRPIRTTTNSKKLQRVSFCWQYRCFKQFKTSALASRSELLYFWCELTRSGTEQYSSGESASDLIRIYIRISMYPHHDSWKCDWDINCMLIGRVSRTCEIIINVLVSFFCFSWILMIFLIFFNSVSARTILTSKVGPRAERVNPTTQRAKPPFFTSLRRSAVKSWPCFQQKYHQTRHVKPVLI